VYGDNYTHIILNRWVYYELIYTYSTHYAVYGFTGY